MHFRALPFALSALLLLSLTQSGRAVPTVPLSTASRGFFDIFSSSTADPTPTPSTTPSSVADLSDQPLDTDPEDEAPEEEAPEEKAREEEAPDVSDSNPVELDIPTETPQSEEEDELQTEPEDSQPEQTPVPPVTPDGDTQGPFDPLFTLDGSDSSDAKAADPRSSGGTQLISAASSGISVLALVAIAVAVLAPALFIYWGIRRRRAAGFNAMPPTTTDNSIYQPASQFSVGE